VIARDPGSYEEGALVLHDHRLNGTQVSKAQQLNTQETLRKIMHNIFYSDDSMKAQEGKATILTGVSGRASAKVHIDPKNLVEVHPIFQKLRAQSLEMIFESAGELMRLYPHHYLYKEGDQ